MDAEEALGLTTSKKPDAESCVPFEKADQVEVVLEKTLQEVLPTACTSVICLFCVLTLS